MCPSASPTSWGGSWPPRHAPAARKKLKATTIGTPMSLDEDGPHITAATRADLGQIWRDYKTGIAPHGDEERRLTLRMSAHADWVEWWERADDVGDALIRTPEGVDPFHFVAAEAAVDGLIDEAAAERDPLWSEYYRDGRAAYARLRRDGLS